MSSRSTVSRRKGKRKQPFTEREARRLLRAARAEGENCILRKLPNGTLELVPVCGAATAATDDGDNLDRELTEFQARHGQGAPSGSAVASERLAVVGFAFLRGGPLS